MKAEFFCVFWLPGNPEGLEQWPAFSICTMNAYWMDARKTVPAVGKASTKDACRSSICVSVCLSVCVCTHPA